MMADHNIEDAEWVEISVGGTSNNRKLPTDRRDLDLQNGKDNPWLNVDFWRSIWSSIRKGGLILLGVIAILMLFAVLVPAEPVVDQGGSGAPNAYASFNSAAVLPAEPPSSEALVGTWIQAERGGEDGRTDCADAEAMTTFNGGSTEAMQFYRNGSVDYTLWYDTMFESHGEPQIRAAYNAGTWALDGNHLNLSWNGGSTGVFGADLGSSDVQVLIQMSDNVMIQSSQGVSTRFVRCL